MAYDKYFLSETPPKIDAKYLSCAIKNSLAEDIGQGDITSQAIIPKHKNIKARIIAKEGFLLCGIDVAEKVFKTVDGKIKFLYKAREGKYIRNKEVLAEISGPAHSILTAERTALNLLSFMSGIATKTDKFVKKIRPFKAKVTDTRKTFPGLRIFEKYAVRVGGGYNHRLKLDEMVLIKDNHLKLLGHSSLPVMPKGYTTEIEAQSLSQFRRILKFKPNIIMLDNMNIKDIATAVKLRSHFPIKLEASGGINLSNIRKLASTGVDIISVGELTDSVKSVDISLDIE